MNPFFRGGRINELLESMSKENYPLLLNLLTNENAENYDPQTDSDDAYNAKENTKSADHSENDLMTEVLRRPTLLHNIKGPIILHEQAVNIAPVEGQIVYHSSEQLLI